MPKMKTIEEYKKEVDELGNGGGNYGKKNMQRS